MCRVSLGSLLYREVIDGLMAGSREHGSVSEGILLVERLVPEQVVRSNIMGLAGDCYAIISYI